ncbi:MAG TPA: RagB/SusD family nutrient uptake outer membrane protein [Chitinophagaceae bacterium]|nr:RagB/SusD family nutrient uptake outer membrane protein [Chitinophagaceae bacterium]
MQASCSKSWLEPDPLSFYTPENTYIDAPGFEAILVTLRKNLNYDFTGNRNPMAMEYAYSDLAIALFQADFTRNTPSSSEFWPLLTFFNKAYEFIKNANVLISRIDDIEWEDQEDRNRLLAEAYWHRAYWYYRLVNSYGDIPWAGNEADGAKLDYRTYSRWAILEKIQEDLEYAREVLPVKAARLGDVTRGTVNHLLTKIYLANTEFDKAINSATEVIDGPYSLVTGRFGKDEDESFRNVMWDLHRPENKNNSQNTETIYTTVDRADAPPEAWSDGAHTMRNFTPAWWKITDGTGERACNWDTPTGDTLGIGNGDVRTNNYYHYEIWKDGNDSWETTSDLRRSEINWIAMGEQTAEIRGCTVGSPMEGKPLNKNTYTDLNDTTDTWYPWPIHKIYIPTPNDRQPRGGQADMYIFRLAETYLLRAEAYYWKEQMDLAKQDINRVRERAKASPVLEADVSIDYIFDERARELYIEEPRHSEMVRVSFIMAKLGKEGYSLDNFHEKNWYYDRVMRVNEHYHAPLFTWYGNVAALKPFHVLWAIPQNVITENTKGRINQNKGYQGAEQNVPPLEEVKME